MADGEKKYFWLKLPRNFFEKHYIKILRGKVSGEYPGNTFGEMLVVFYIWLLAECIDHEGKLRYSETKPYDEELLADVSGFPLSFVRKALTVYKNLELVTEESDKTLFLPKSLKMIGSESASAKRVREYRNRQRENQKPDEEKRYNVTPSNGDVQKSNESKKEEEKPPYDEIISYLNEKTHSKYKSGSKATQRLINGRWKDGFRLDDFKAVIDIKSDQWLSDKKMASYLRPETLFAASHFESYLNECGAVEKKTAYSGIREQLAKETDSKIDGDTGNSSDFY